MGAYGGKRPPQRTVEAVEQVRRPKPVVRRRRTVTLLLMQLKFARLLLGLTHGDLMALRLRSVLAVSSLSQPCPAVIQMSPRLRRTFLAVAGFVTASVLAGLAGGAVAKPFEGGAGAAMRRDAATSIEDLWTPPSCDATPTLSAFDPDTQWDRIVLDPSRHLQQGWEPDDLVEIPALGRHTDGRVRAIILDDLVAMYDAALEADAPFDVVSGFRSAAQQDYVHSQSQTHSPSPDGTPDLDAGPPMVAPPGHSEHQLGTTIDIVDPSEISLTSAVADTPGGRWLAAHATEHGFVFSYPEFAAPITCYGWEPWHLRWVGVDRAAVIEASGLTPREFMLREADGQLP